MNNQTPEARLREAAQSAVTTLSAYSKVLGAVVTSDREEMAKVAAKLDAALSDTAPASQSAVVSCATCQNWRSRLDHGGVFTLSVCIEGPKHIQVEKTYRCNRYAALQSQQPEPQGAALKCRCVFPRDCPCPHTEMNAELAHLGARTLSAGLASIGFDLVPRVTFEDAARIAEAARDAGGTNF